MKIFNTLTREKQEFVPITPGEAKIYACGPTVYNYIHIGNARPLCVFDVLRRYLEWRGMKVNFVQNFTDIDDKLINKANQEGITVREVAERYIKEFWTDAKGLNVREATVHPRATENIDEIIKIISTLVEKGYAYQAGGNVYFDTSKLEKYYIFNEHNEEDLAVGVREGVEEDTNKRNKNDFVLWFTKSKFEDQALKWDSPWGVGYPGWHIECSGISLKYLGEDLDIHCGGIDNAFPHHTNEIAQSESYIGHHWCNYWMHVMHLNTTSGKMSKSKGEFLTVSLLEQKGYDPLAYRLFCLQSHYRKNLVFTWENLDNAMGTYQKLIAKIAALKPSNDPIDDQAVAALREKFNKALGNDLNTSLGITALYDVLKYKTNDATKLFVLDDFDKVLSLDLCKKADEIRKRNAAEKPAAGAYSIFCEDGSDDPAVTAQIQARYDAKKAKNFAEADRIRDELKSQGIEITDIPGRHAFFVL